MNAIHIERLDLKCGGIPPATAQAAVRELGLALHHQLHQNGVVASDAGSGVIRVAGTGSSAALADTIAARVARIIHAHAPQAGAFRKP